MGGIQDPKRGWAARDKMLSKRRGDPEWGRKGALFAPPSPFLRGKQNISKGTTTTRLAKALCAPKAAISSYFNGWR